MSIVSVEITEDGGSPRTVRYRLTDSTGATHDYGPVFAAAGFDAEAFKTPLAAKIAERLAEQEAAQVVA